MPQWGLTTEMRQSGPWRLPEWLLAPAKVITDPIHGDIYTTKLEQALADTAPFQRLRRVRQLGTTHLVYPAALHNRFTHSLGSLRVVQDLLDRVLEQRYGNHPVPDLFEQWESGHHLPSCDDDADPLTPDDVRRRALRAKSEAVVLARLGALLHDLCHIPFGHSVEDDLGILDSHDANAIRFGELWDEIHADLKERLKGSPPEQHAALATLRPGGDLYRNLRPLILSHEVHLSTGEPIDPVEAIEYPFVADMVGNTICADLLDYLQRDHRFTGLPMNLGQRFMSAFYVTPAGRGGLYQQRMALLIHRKGRLRKDITTEILKHLRYRYELQERVLVHHTKLSADAMIGKMIELLHAGLMEEDQGGSPRPSPRRRRLESIPRLSRERGRSRSDVKTQIEDLFLEHGDDGLLEHLSMTDSGELPARRTASDLATQLLNRRLYAHVANASGAYAAEDLYEAYSEVGKRTDLERQAVSYAGIETVQHLIIWLPPPQMRLKLAEMLVDHGKGIAKFVDFSPLGSDIYELHKSLWTVGVFVHRSVTETQRQAALARLAELMGICWDSYERQLGSTPSEWPDRLAAMQVLEVLRTDGRVERLVQKAKALAERGTESHASRYRELKAVARREKMLDPPKRRPKRSRA